MKHNKLKKTVMFVSFLTAFIPFVVYAGGIIQLPQTGQATCYDASGTVITCLGTGQDGDILAGMPWPNPRFTDNGDQTMLDNLTGLIWTKDGNLMKTRDPGFDTDATGEDGEVYWEEAINYIKKLNKENYLGHNDWRLPNVKELDSLAHVGQQNIANWLNLKGFSNVQPSNYFSSSGIANFEGLKYVVDMYSGLVTYGLGGYVWPVRSVQPGSLGSSISLPRIGQTICYKSIGCTGTGQDGELQMGVPWPNPRFTDNGDQTVMDNLTGLIWTKDGKTPGPTTCTEYTSRPSWQEALNYVKCLNKNNYLGYNDWRLPNYKELDSLVHVGQSNTVTWLNLQGFSNVQDSNYWSSDTYAYIADFVWMVSMSYGRRSTESKSSSWYVWPVRYEKSGSLPKLAANAGANQVVFDKATLDGSASQGNIISWNWTLTHRTNPAYNLTATGQKPNLDNLPAGFYDVRLAISDGTTTSTATNLLVVAGPWDISGDGKLGLAEAIYILQKAARIR